MTGTPTYDDLARRCRARGLDIFGAFHPGPDDRVPGTAATLLLLGPGEPGFWERLTTSEEWRDGRPDPIDRWSRRVVGRLACDLAAKALFPFTGPPWHPFFSWAVRSGRAWPSPVQLLVHDRAGLMLSYRGALALRERIALPPAPDAPPCTTCTGKPCRTACPAGALTPAGYDVPAGHAFLDTGLGADCMGGGCAVRRACPASRAYGRLPQQSAYHMRQFHRGKPIR